MTFELWIAGFALVWIACGILAAGFCFAYFQGAFPSIADKDFGQDLRWSLISGLCLGPIALITTIIQTGCKHGWRLWRKKSESEIVEPK